MASVVVKAHLPAPMHHHFGFSFPLYRLAPTFFLLALPAFSLLRFPLLQLTPSLFTFIQLCHLCVGWFTLWLDKAPMDSCPTQGLRKHASMSNRQHGLPNNKFVHVSLLVPVLQHDLLLACLLSISPLSKSRRTPLLSQDWLFTLSCKTSGVLVPLKRLLF